MIVSGLDQIEADASCDKEGLTPSDTKATSQGSFPGIFFFYSVHLKIRDRTRERRGGELRWMRGGMKGPVQSPSASI